MASSTTKDHLPATAPAHLRPPFSSSSSSVAQPAEDESRKKNTDCVYFLASPLTCKKGSECEYRHSEYARVNPRDCWFWLNGNCLNPKCSFRHPPLDTSLGTPVDSSVGSSGPGSSGAAVGSLLPPLQAVSSALNVAKSSPPCIFFQKGYCLKGDRCPFSHVQNPTSNKTPEFPAAHLSESSSLNNASGGLKKCSQLKIAPQANVSKPIEVIPSQPKTSVHGVKAVPNNGAFAEKRGVPYVISNEDLPKHEETTLPSLNNGYSRNKFGSASQASSLDEQKLQSGKEADDLLRESSPGFDVLVDDELRDTEYFGNEDQFPRIQGHEGRNLNEFEIGRPDGYNSVDDVDPVIYPDRYGYDKSMQERRARDHYRASERSIIEGSHSDPRDVYKGVSPDGVGHSDLRHRLSKQRRGSGLSSVVNADYSSDILAEVHSYRSARRDSHHSPPRGSSFSSRLQGRIKRPRQPSTVSPPSLQSDREYDEGRNRSRFSPSRSQPESHHGRLQDRLRGRTQDNIGRDATSKREILDYNSSDFAAPKTLAELKRAKQSNSYSRELLKRSEEITSVGKRKLSESSQDTEDDLSFEGPKPLSEILKRKRKAEEATINSQIDSISGIERESKSSKPKQNAAVEKQRSNEEEENKPNEDPFVAPKQEANLPAHTGLCKPVAAEESEAQSLHSNEKTKLTETKISQANNVLESKEGSVEDHELEDEYYEEGDGEYEDEQVDGEGEEADNLDEGENGAVPEDYMDEDDGDNFAKKIGVVFS